MADPSADEKQSDTNFGDEDPEDVFEILQPIGEGAYGAVYKARDIRTQELVALKIMPSEAESGALEREVNLIKKCKSPFIANFKSSFLKEGNIWLAMEYCSAGAVLDIMKVLGDDESFTEDQICIIMRETLKGLSYLHSKNVLHRDIKAGNILLNDKGQCKLADFGVSKGLEHTMDQAKTVIGTPYWMAPETFQGKPYDTKADIWSLGITAIEMACGRPPHSDKPPLQAIFLIPKSPPPTLPEEDDWTDEFRDWLSQCCDKDSKTRPDANQLLKHEWFNKQNLSLNMTLELVKHVQPLIDALREDQRKADEGSGGDYDTQNYGTGDYDDYEDGDGDGDDGGYNDGTMVAAYDDDEDDEDEDDEYNDDEDDAHAGGGDVFDGSTMLVAADADADADDAGDDMGDAADGGYGDDGDDDGQADQYGTLLINEDAMEVAKDQYDNDNDNDNGNETNAKAKAEADTNETSNKANDSKNESDETKGESKTDTDEENKQSGNGKGGTGAVPVEASNMVQIERYLEFESVFKGNEYLDKYMPIPNNVSKTELIEIWHAVRNTSRDDKKIFEQFYKDLLDQLDDMLAKMA